MARWTDPGTADPDRWEMRQSTSGFQLVLTLAMSGIFLLVGLVFVGVSVADPSARLFALAGAPAILIGLAALSVALLRRRLTVDRRHGEVLLTRRVLLLRFTTSWPIGDITSVERTRSEGTDRWHAEGNPIPYWYLRLLGPEPPVSLKGLLKFESESNAQRSAEALATFLGVPATVTEQADRDSDRADEAEGLHPPDE